MSDLDIPNDYESILDKLLTKTLSGIFFSRRDFDPMEFCMSPAKKVEEGNILKKFKLLIEKCGGSLKFNMSAGGLNVIKFVHSKRVDFQNDDYFLSQFIIDSVDRNRVQKLDKYRATKTLYPNIDPNYIMFGLKTWEDARKSGRETCRGEVSDDFSDEEEVVPGTSKSTFKTSERRKFYSINEERDILNFILKKKYFFKVKGNTLWQKMEKEKICGSRTWQSMKERYLHHIIPRLKQFKLDPITEKKLLTPFSDEKEGSFDDIKSIHEEGEKKNRISPKKINCKNANNENQTNIETVAIDDEEEENYNKQELGRDIKEQEAEIGEQNKEKETKEGGQNKKQEIEKNKEQNVDHVLNKEQVVQNKQKEHQKVDGDIKSNVVQSGTRILKNKSSSLITNIPNQSPEASEINVNNDTRKLLKTKKSDDVSQSLDYVSNKDQESAIESQHVGTRSGKNTSSAASDSNLYSDSNTENISSTNIDPILVSDLDEESCTEKDLIDDLVSIWDSSVNENECSGKANPMIEVVPPSPRPRNDVLEQTTTLNNGNSNHLSIIPDTENEELKRPVNFGETQPFSVESLLPVANLDGKVRCNTDEIVSLDQLMSADSTILYSANKENGLNLNESASSCETEKYSSDDNSVDTVICNYITLNSSEDLKSISHEDVNNIAPDAIDVEIPLQVKKKKKSPQKSNSSLGLEEMMLSLVSEKELEKSAPIAKSKNKRENCNDESVPSTSLGIEKENNRPKRRRISGTESESSDLMKVVESENDNTSTFISREICRGEVSDDFSEDEEVVPGTSKSTFKTSERRKFYSINEEREILNYILKKKYYFRVKGNAMWQKMEKEKICGSRTWQSMKERYIHRIIPRLKQFKLDPITEKKLLSLFNNKKKGFFSDHDNELTYQEGEKMSSISPKKIICNSINNENHNNSTIVTIDDEEDDNEQELVRDNKEQETGGGPMIEIVPPSLMPNNEVLEQTTTPNDGDSNHLRIIPDTENEEMTQDIDLDETQYFSSESSLPVVNLGEKVQCNPNEIVRLDHLGSASSRILYSSNKENGLNLNESASSSETEKCADDNNLNTVTYNHNALNSSEDLKSISHEDVNNIALDASDVEIPLQVKKKKKSPQKSTRSLGLEEIQLHTDSENELEEESSPITRSKNKRENKYNDESVPVPSTSSGVKKESNRPKRRRISETESESSESVVLQGYSLRVKDSKQSKKEQWPQISESDNDSDISTTFSRTQGAKKYQEIDDLCILKHIYKNKLFDSVKGKQMWEDMEKKKVLPGRTWHSLKERFRKRILPRIKSYKNLSEKVVESFLECGGGGGENDRGHRPTTLNYVLAEDECILDFIIKNKRYKEIKGKAMWISMSKFKSLKKRTWESLKNRFLQNIAPNLHLYDLDDEEKRNFQKVLENNRKKQHTKYTRHEDENILDFIIKNKRYRAIKGKTLWISMADQFKDRSWESLKNRFLNVIVPNLPFYKIDKEAKDKFKKALKAVRKQSFKPPSSPRYKRVLRKKKSDSNRKRYSSSSDEESSSQVVDSSSSDDETDEEKQDNNKNINSNSAAVLSDSDDIYPSTGNEDVNTEETASRNSKDTSANDEETMQLRLRLTPVKSNEDQDGVEKNEENLDGEESGRKNKGFALTDSDDTSPNSLYNIHRRKLFPTNRMFIKLYEKTPAEDQSKRERKVWPKIDKKTPGKKVGESLNQSFEAEQVDLQKETNTNSHEGSKSPSELNKTIGRTSQLPESESRVQSKEGVNQPTQSTEADNSEVRTAGSQLPEINSREQSTEGINQPIDVNNFEVRTVDFHQIPPQTPTGRKSKVCRQSYSERRPVLNSSPLRKTRSESKRRSPRTSEKIFSFSSPRKSPRNNSTTLRTNLRRRKIQSSL